MSDKQIVSLGFGPADFARPKTYYINQPRFGSGGRSTTLAAVNIPLMLGDQQIATLSSAVYLQENADPTKGETTYSPSASLPNGKSFAFASKMLSDQYREHVMAELKSWNAAGFARRMAEAAFREPTTDKPTPAADKPAKGK